MADSVPVGSDHSACLSCRFKPREAPMGLGSALCSWGLTTSCARVLGSQTNCICSFLSLYSLHIKWRCLFFTIRWFALSSRSKSLHCYFCLNSSVEVSVYLKILVMILVIFMCASVFSYVLLSCLFLSLTFWLYFHCKALITPYVEHVTLDSVKVKWWEDRINFVSPLFSSCSLLL